MIHPDLPIKALSIRQPWIWAILHMGKRIENRPRRFHYRGPICLHASKGCTEMEISDFLDFIDDQFPSSDVRSRAGVIDTAINSPLGRGGILGVADIVDCVEHSDSRWFFGPYGLVLDNVRPVPFIPVKGALGLFDWRRNLVEAA